MQTAEASGHKAPTRLPAAVVLGMAAVSFVLLGTMTAAFGLDPAHEGRFSDDDGNTHEANIEAIAAAGITFGCNPPENTLFCPRDTLSRGQMAAFMARALDLESAGASPFTDDDNSLFEADIAAIANAGITVGCNPPLNTEYCPTAPVTRGQLAAFLARAFDLGEAATEDWFVDDDDSIFETQINQLKSAGITVGCNPPDNTRYCPTAPVRRDEMASLLARALGIPPVPANAVLIGAGDIANGSSNVVDTAALIAGFPDATVFTTGDNAYPDGSFTDYAEHYEPTWGAFKDRTRPSIGNHDARTHGAVPYFATFGDNAGVPGEGWYSYDLGEWHVIVLNSECGDSGLASCSDQLSWLAADLAANPRLCSLAYWHKPVFNSGRHSGSDAMLDAWEMLDDAGVDMVLNGHDHNYQRYAQQNSAGIASPTGMRQFIVGTGGASSYEIQTPLPTLEEAFVGYGVLKLDLQPNAYSWTFLSTTGTFTDVGTTSCG